MIGKEKLIVIVLILTAAVFFFSADLMAEKIEYNLNDYLEKGLDESRELTEAEFDLYRKEIELEKEKAEQEVRPSPLRLKKAELELQIAEKNLEIRKDQIINQIVKDFFNYYKAVNIIEINEKYVNILQEELKNIEQKYEEGLLIKSDLLQAEVELKTAESNLVEAQNNKKRAAFRLKQNINLEYKNEVNIVFDGNMLNWKLTENLDSLFAAAINNRIEIREAEVNNELQQINHKIASAEYSTKLAEKSAENDLLDSENKLKMVKDKIKLDVNNKYLTYQDSRENINRYQKLIESLTEALRIKELYFEEDYITGTELLETQVDLYQAEINYSHARIDYYLSLAELYLSTGDFEEMLIYENK
ncbi:MAG: TolC family protein [Bacillota bacterium]